MTLDDDRVGWREAARREEEHYRNEARREWEERNLLESVEAMEAHWRGVFRAGAEHWSSTQHWDGT